MFSLDLDLENAIGKTGDVLAYIDDLCKHHQGGDLKGLDSGTRILINEVLREKENSNKKLVEEIRRQANRIQILESTVHDKADGTSPRISSEKASWLLDELSDISAALEETNFSERSIIVKKLKDLALGITASEELIKQSSNKSPLSPCSPFEDSLKFKCMN